MDRERFEDITTRYLHGKASPEEEGKLIEELDVFDERLAEFRQRTAEWNPLEEQNPEMDRKWNRLAAIVQPSREEKEAQEVSLPTHSRKTFWLSMAAAVLLCCVSGITVYLLNVTGKDISGQNDWLTVIAETGDRSCVLPDGSSVYLREGAELRYPHTFDTSTRQVQIQGEAFFEVSPDKQKPFIVDAAGLSIQVLGTAFSVQTSESEKDVSVILLTGKVSLSHQNKELAVLLPDQQADYSAQDNACTITQVDSERLTSWRKGIISYDNASLEEIVRLIEQTYQVSLSYTESSNDTQRFSGAFRNNQSLETVLQQTSKLTGTTFNTR